VVAVGPSAAEQIAEMVARETRAWDTQDVDLLLSIFHPDFVWVWPEDAKAHDPARWKIGLGRFDRERWGRLYEQLFADYELAGNDRTLVKIEVAPESDGAFAVVDIDTRWRRRETGEVMRWLGRVCKVYALVSGDWKLVGHTGALDYGAAPQPAG